MRSAFLLGLLVFTTIARGADPSPIDLGPLKKWLAEQAAIRTLSADFVQTRTLKPLRTPLVQNGHVWFRTPDAFRWEIGRPPITIALRRGADVYLISTKPKKAQHFPANSLAQQAGLQEMALMKFPLATDLADFQSHFQILSLQKNGSAFDLRVLPRDAAAQKYLRDILISFDPADSRLLAFQVTFKDGSSLRNDFSHPQINGLIDLQLFNFDLTGYQIRNADN